jgi:DNA-directed RNA polymerase specialized sigma24 family protein
MRALGWSAEKVDASADLRKRFRREQAERLVERAAGLPDSDRILVELVLGEGRSVSDIAALRNVPDQALRRHLRRLIRRLASDEYVFVSRHLFPPHGGECRWSPIRRRVAEACVLRGMSMRQAARLLNLSLHTVRKHRHALSAMVESVRA